MEINTNLEEEYTLEILDLISGKNIKNLTPKLLKYIERKKIKQLNIHYNFNSVLPSQ